MRSLTRFLERARLARLSDGELVELAARGDKLAFGELFLRHVDDVLAYIVLRVRDREVAEELTQDVFLKVFEALPRFRWQGQIRPWLLRIAHNRVANHWRTQQRRPGTAELPEDDEAALALPGGHHDPEEMAELSLDSEAVMRALERLSDAQREVIALRFGNELSVAETAEVMQRSEGAITNLQYYAVAKLRRYLGSRDGAT